jgi:hypothetical protein
MAQKTIATLFILSAFAIARRIAVAITWPQKITFAEMRDIGVCGLLIYLLRQLQLLALA